MTISAAFPIQLSVVLDTFKMFTISAAYTFRWLAVGDQHISELSRASPSLRLYWINLLTAERVLFHIGFGLVIS